MSLHIAKAISALQNILWLILGMGFVSLVQAQVVGEDLVLQDITIGAGENETYEATKTITTAGDDDAGAPTTFVVKAGGRATLKARTRIELKAGTRIESGAFFRVDIDPEAGSPTSSPTITILEPNGVDDTGDESYSVTWSDEDPDSDASIFLYYDPDNVGEDGTPINLSPISEDDETDTHVWDTSDVLEGSYYVYGVIDDSVNPPVVDYSGGTVRINHNNSPIANDDSATTNEDTPVVIDVLANDTDVDVGDTLTIVSFSQGEHGSVSESEGNLVYTPDADYHGSDSFTYEVSDGHGGTDMGTVNVTVTGINDPPVAEDDSATTDEDVSVLIFVLSNDTDADGDVLTIGSFTQGSDGVVTINNARTRLRYTPNADYHGPDSFTYKVIDTDEETDMATVNVTVTSINDDPEANDDEAETQEDTPVTVDVLANDTDADEEDTLTIDSFTQGSNGSVSESEGALVYTPNAGYHGPDSFTYKVGDGNGGTDMGTVSITVNGAPVANDDKAETQEDIPVIIDVLANDTDPDGDALTIASFNTETANGTVSQDGNSLEYTPDADFNGEDSFDYEVSDGHGGMDTGTVDVMVTSVNDPPVAGDDSATTDEDVSVLIFVLSNDTHADGDVLTIGSFTQGSDGVVTINNARTRLRYTPNADYHGPDSFTYKVIDTDEETDMATVNVTVTSINDDPEANDDEAETQEDTPVAIDVLANDTDADEEDTLTIDSFTQGSNGSVSESEGNLVYMPNADYHGPDSFTYKVGDGNGGTDMGTVSITVNGAPEANDNEAETQEDIPVTIDVLANDTDPDGDTLTIASFIQGDHGSVSQSGDELVYTPDADYHGSDSFTYEVSDGHGGIATGTVDVMVTSVNDAPEANEDSATTVEDVSVLIFVLSNDTDADGDVLTIPSFMQGNHGVVTTNTARTRLRYTPNANTNGSDSFTYEVSDGNEGMDTGRVTVTVTAVNDPPVANDDVVTTVEDTAVTIDVLANDTDPDVGDTLSIVSFTQGDHGSVSRSGTDLVYTPNANFNGLDSFDYVVRDSAGERDTGTVMMTVIAVNDAPVANEDSATTVEDTPVTIDVLANDTDIDLDLLSVVSFSQGFKGSVSRSEGDENHLVYTPNLNENGPDSFTYEVSDGNEGMATGTVSIAVTAVNDAPRFIVAPPTGVDAGDKYDYTPTVSDVDAGDILSFSIVNQPSWADFDPLTGRLWGIPSDLGLFENIEITVTDDSGTPNNSSSLTFNVTVLQGAEAAAPWKILSSRTGEKLTLYFGQHGDTPVACDYDGDGITDLAVWRTYRNSVYGNGPLSLWIIRQSSNDYTMVEYFGDLNGEDPVDVPVQADYDGDGYCDMAYLDITGDHTDIPPGNTWYIKESESGDTVTRTWNPDHSQVEDLDDFRILTEGGEWARTGAVPAPADYDGDGKADLGAFWPYRAAWTYQPSSGGNDVEFVHGMRGEQVEDHREGLIWEIYDLPVPADYNNEDDNDKAQAATWRPMDREWTVRNKPPILIGSGLEIPVAGDFDGDGAADPTLFVQTPDITMTHVSDDITAGGEWPDRQGELTIMDDNGTYRMTLCSGTKTAGMADDIFYSESSSPTGGFSDPQRIIVGSCEHTLLKVPSTINPVFEDQCGSNPVYLLYAASERWDLSEATFHKPSNAPHNELYRWPPPLNEPQNPDLWPDRIGNRSAWVWEGLKVVLYSACGNLGDPQSWIRRGPVLTIPPIVPGTGSEHDPIGTGQPTAIYQDGTIYISHSYDAEVGHEDETKAHLGVSTNGINFIDTGISGVKRSNRVHGLGQSNSVIGHTWGSVDEYWTGPAEGGYTVEVSSYLHFSKDLGNLKAPRTHNQYKHLQHLLRFPKTKACNYAPGVLESPHGVVEGNATYIYSPEWNFNYYCSCRKDKPTGHNIPDTEEPDMCIHRLNDNTTWSLRDGEVSVSEVVFNFTETGCIGNRYSSCSDGSCTGAQRMRTCTAEDTWGEWIDLE